MNAEVSAALIIIGNEVLSGRTQDVNLQYIARGLNGVGVRLREVRVIADDEAAIVEAVNTLRGRHAHVFTTGGIGPTHDDITTDSIAKAFGVPVRRDPEAVARLLRQIKPESLNEARLRMANIPDGARLIDNPISHAPGYTIGNVHVLAGVPAIMRAMFDGILPSLEGGRRILSRSITLHVGEGAIAGGLGDIQRRHPEAEIGSYPFSRDGAFGTEIVARGTTAADLAAVIGEVASLARATGARYEEDGGSETS